MSEEFNKSLPYGPWAPKDGGKPRIETDYPYVRAEADINGKVVAVFADPDQPEKSSEVTFNHDGSYTTRERNDEYKGVVTSLDHLSLGYNSGGKSNQVDGHVYENSEATAFRQTAGDSGTAAGGNKYDGVSGRKIGGTGEGSFENHSEGNVYKTTKGDMITEHTGGSYYALEGDDVRCVTGSKVDMISEGEYGIHVQGGNMAARVETGTLNLYSADKFTANTLTSMQLKAVTTMDLDSTGPLTVNSMSTLAVKSIGPLTINSASTGYIKTIGNLTLEAPVITLMSGSSQIIISPTGVSIVGPTISIIGAATTTVAGPQVTIAGPSIDFLPVIP